MSVSILCTVFLLATLVHVSLQVDADIATMKRLYGDKLDDYDTRIRPINNQSRHVAINTKFVPQSLLEFDTSEQKFSMLGYYKIHWMDEVLTWDPAGYDGVKELKVPINEMWRPSLIILKVTFSRLLVI